MTDIDSFDDLLAHLAQEEDLFTMEEEIPSTPDGLGALGESSEPMHTFIPDTNSDSVACAMSRDFVVIGDQEATTVLRESLGDPHQATFLVNQFYPTRPFEDFSVCKGSQKVFTEPNAGGNSVNSEAMSFEVLHRLYGARLVKTEMAIAYYHPNWKKTDYSIHLFGHHVGVSVTRAMKHRGPFTVEDGEILMQKKLNGVNISTIGVVRADRWEKQILHVWAQNADTAQILRKVYMELPPALRSNTIVIVTVSDRTPYLFRNCNERPKMIDQLMSIG